MSGENLIFQPKSTTDATGRHFGLHQLGSLSSPSDCQTSTFQIQTLYTIYYTSEKDSNNRNAKQMYAKKEIKHTKIKSKRLNINLIDYIYFLIKNMQYIM